MQYRIDPKSGNKISVLGFGCMRFPKHLGRIDMDKTEELVIEAINRGVNYFDTAYIYPGSEAALGEILSKNNVRDKVFIATKLPIMMCKKQTDFDKFFNTELERLQTDYIDYYFMHMITSPAQWNHLCELGIEEWIQDKKDKGIIKQVGFSFHGKKDDFLKLIDLYDWDFCQIQYNYLNINYQAGVTGLKYASNKGLPVFIMEPLLGGRLAFGLPEEAKRIMKKSNPNYTPVSWALKWIWNQEEVTMLLSGMNEMNHVIENTDLASNSLVGSLTKDEEEVINQVIEVVNKSYKVQCTACGYCMPCPVNIDIPGCFASYNASFSTKKITGFTQYFQNTGAMTEKEPTFASTCIKCGKCETHCPQEIAIREELVNVSKRLEPSWLMTGLKVVRKVVK